MHKQALKYCAGHGANRSKVLPQGCGYLCWLCVFVGSVGERQQMCKVPVGLVGLTCSVTLRTIVKHLTRIVDASRPRSGIAAHENFDLSYRTVIISVVILRPVGITLAVVAVNAHLVVTVQR